MVTKTNASVVSGSNTLDTNSDVSDTSQQANEHEMTDLSQENEDDGSIINKIETNCFKYKVFVHVFDQCRQDSETIITILNDVLCRVKETDPQIKNAFIGSDNTGYYRSANTVHLCQPSKYQKEQVPLSGELIFVIHKVAKVFVIVMLLLSNRIYADIQMKIIMLLVLLSLLKHVALKKK